MEKVIDKFLEPIFEEFLEDRHEDLKICEQAIQENDLEKTQSVGHRLAGNAASYGLPELGDLGKKLEQESSTGNLEAVRSIHEQIKTFLNDLTVRFD